MFGRETRLNQLFTYIQSYIFFDGLVPVKNQPENDVSADLRVMLIQWKVLPKFLLTASPQLTIVKTNQNSFRINGSTNQERMQVWNKLSQTVDNVVILISEQNQNQEEVKMKVKILQCKAQQLEQQLNCSDIIIDSFANLPQQFDNSQNSFTKQFFALLDNQGDLSIDSLQEKFQTVINEQIKQKKYRYSLCLSHQPQLAGIEQKLQYIYPFVQVMISELDSQNIMEFHLLIEYIVWYTADTDIPNMENVRKHLVQLIQPTLSIKLNDTNKQIWNFISKKYQPQSLESTIDLSISEDSISIMGDMKFSRILQEQITTDLSVCQITHITCKLTDKKILNALKLDANIVINKINCATYNITFKCTYNTLNCTENKLKTQLNEQLISKIQIYRVNYLNEFIQFLNMEQHEFQQQYSCLVVNDGFIICTNKSYQSIQPKIENYEVIRKSQEVNIEIQENNPLILKYLELNIISKLILVYPKIKFSIKQNTIIISGEEQFAYQAQEALEKEIKLTQQKYVKQKININDKAAKYFSKYFLNEINTIQQQENCKITIVKENQIQNQTVLALRFQVACLNLVYGNILNFKSEAIVNSCNQQLTFGNHNTLTGVAQSIFEIGGKGYQEACQEYIKKNQELKYGKIFAYNCDTDGMKYILTMATPFHQQATQAVSNLKIITKNIEQVFKVADNLKIQEITIPIFGAGTAGQYYGQIAETVLNAAIKGIYKYSTRGVKVNLIEKDLQKVNQVINIITSIANKTPKRQIKYQWQWMDKTFKDYDDEYVNEQIDVAYEKFLLDNKQNQLRLIFPHYKLPGTHIVDLQNNTLKDIQLLKTQKITQSLHNGFLKYQFGDQVVPDDLNEFIAFQQSIGNLTFNIFYKKHKIIFSNTGIQQINEETNYIRQVQFIPYTQQQSSQQILFNGTDMKMQLYQVSQQFDTKLTLTIEIVEKSNFDRVSEQISNLINQDLVDMTIKIPYLKESDLKELKQFLEKKAHQINDPMLINKQLTLKVFKNKKNKVENHLQFVIDKLPQYPDHWQKQQKNYEKFELNQNDIEYQKIGKLFQATNPKGRIDKIFRIQNQFLWDNYATERKKLIQLKSAQNISLQQEEVERYLWHGVSKQHPSVIYSKEKEAFDVTYNRVDCLWGPGSYFAERASYSHEYSFELAQGKFIFLCCLVTTGIKQIQNSGKVHYCNQDNTIRRPPDGFDCVSGFTLGSQVYVLYQMDVRRAYPAYEVEYEKIP